MTAAKSADSGRRSLLNWFNPLASGAGAGGRLVRLVLFLVLLYFVCTPFINYFEYHRAMADFFDPRPSPGASADAGAAPAPPPAGTVFTDALIVMTEQMLGSWLPNDLIYPTVLMDNPQNFQLGELEVIRYSVRVLRDKLSRQRTTDKIDPYADQAFTEFSNNPRLWIFPAAESKFAAAVGSLRQYRSGLEKGGSHFFPRADNLIELLDQYTSLLGGVDTRLANAPRDWREHLSEETAGDRYTSGEQRQRVEVPWTEIDDNFYFARGVAYGLREMMMAVRWEFAEVLRLKRSDELMRNIIDELALAQFEPLMVLNGARSSIHANHSLTMMATLEDVRQKMINLQNMLER